jgi:hypothetical protein
MQELVDHGQLSPPADEVLVHYVLRGRNSSSAWTTSVLSFSAPPRASWLGRHVGGDARHGDRSAWD